LNNSSVISWRSVLLVEETWVPWENHRSVASHWQTLSHHVVSSMNENEILIKMFDGISNRNYTYHSFHKYLMVINMKQAQPWMRANLKIICRFHAQPVHQHSVEMLGPRYVGDDFLRVETSLVQSNSRSSKVNVRCADKKFLSVCQKRFN
jgi:hypothetical protein